VRNVADKIVEKIKTHISCSANFYPECCRSWANLHKYCRAGQATDDDTWPCIKFFPEFDEIA